MIKKLLIVIFILCGIKAFSQPATGIYFPNNVTFYGEHKARVAIDSALLGPTTCGKPISLRSSYRGLYMQVYDSCNNVLWIYNPKSTVMDWDSVHIGAELSSGVTSVTGTTNRITSTGGANPIINISPSYDDSVKSWINIASGNIIDTSYYSNLYSKSLGAYSGASTTYNNIFFGSQSGKLTTIGEYHDNIFMGNQSGKFGATIVYVTNSNFLGNYAGSNSYNAYNSNFFGKATGSNSANAANSNFMGEESGVNATNASNSNFFGNFAGNSSTNASNSNFFGNSAGNSATNASNSNFFGNSTGYGATNADHCNFFGYGTGRAFPGNNVGSNNIIIGTNISLPDATTDAINIGAILFGKNTNSDGIGDPKIVPSTNGKIGILVVNPDSTLHVAGSGHFRDYLRVEKADSISSPTNMLTMASDGTIKKAAVPSGGGSGVNSVSGTVNRISIAGTSSDPIIGISAAYDDTVKNWISDSIDNNAVTFRNAQIGDTLLTNPSVNEFLVKSLVAGTNVTLVKTDTTITINSSGGGGDISGTAAADQVVVGSGTNTVSSSSALKFNTTTGLIVNETNSVAATFQRNAANTTFTQIDVAQPKGYPPAGDAVSILALGSFYSSTGIYQADGGTIVAGAGMSAGLNIATVHSSAPVKVWTNGNERMRIMPSGYVGIGTSSPTSTLHNVGSFATAYVAKTANYTATASDYTINFTSGTDTLTLPTAVGITGRIYTIVNSGTSVNIKTTSSQTFLNVSGTPTTINLLAVGATQVQSTGAAWIKLN